MRKARARAWFGRNPQSRARRCAGRPSHARDVIRPDACPAHAEHAKAGKGCVDAFVLFASSNGSGCPAGSGLHIICVGRDLVRSP
jgi:hypothetical protein